MNRLCVSVILLLGIHTQLLWAHEGHDHGDAGQNLRPRGDVVQRLPDGQVFVPKPAQRLMGVRTQPTVLAAWPQTLELPGKVIMDPHVGGRVQSMIAGRIESVGAHGLPAAGSRVRRGDRLAWVVPASGYLERAGVQGQLAELKAAERLAMQKLARYESLVDIVPRKDVEAVESELASVRGRIAAMSSGLVGREALVAPVSGVLAASNAVVGQVVEPKELIFEIIDPDSLHIEALSFAPLNQQEVRGASVQVGTQAVPLQFVGAPRRLREQALPLIFENHATGAGLALPLGTPVQIQVQLRSTVRGMPLPQTALVRNTANEQVVWVKTGPEQFQMRPVQFVPLDGVRVLVQQGLSEGERVVTEAASLINQIR